MARRPALGDADAAYRTPEERLAVAATRLTDDRDCWFITASRHGGPHVVPLSFLAFGARVVLATGPDRPAALNVREDPRVVLILGGYGDAMRLRGDAVVVPFEGLDPQVRVGYVEKAGWDPAGAEYVGLLVTLSEILCSRSPAEDRDPVVWKAGAPTLW